VKPLSGTCLQCGHDIYQEDDDGSDDNQYRWIGHASFIFWFILWLSPLRSAISWRISGRFPIVSDDWTKAISSSWKKIIMIGHGLGKGISLRSLVYQILDDHSPSLYSFWIPDRLLMHLSVLIRLSVWRQATWKNWSYAWVWEAYNLLMMNFSKKSDFRMVFCLPYMVLLINLGWTWGLEFVYPEAI